MNALLHHIGVYVTLFTKNNYVAILVSYISNLYHKYYFRSFLHEECVYREPEIGLAR